MRVAGRCVLLSGVCYYLGKCKCLHTGHGNLDIHYKTGDAVLCTIIKENDLRETIIVDMKFQSSVALQLQRVIQFFG